MRAIFLPSPISSPAVQEILLILILVSSEVTVPALSVSANLVFRLTSIARFMVFARLTLPRAVFDIELF